MTVYVDGVFALNSAVNYLLLLGTDRLCGGVSRRIRLLLSALLGGLYAAAALFPGLGFLQTVGMKLTVLLLMLLAAFGWQRKTVRLGLIFAALSAAFAGIVLLVSQLFANGLLLLDAGVYYPVSFFGLVLTAAALYLLIRFVFFRFFEHGGGQIVPLTLRLGENAIPLRALRDTGNTLRDPITAENVVVAEWTALARLLPDEKLTAADFSAASELFSRLSAKYPRYRFRLLPYRTVGTENAMLLAVRCDSEQNGKIRRQLAAFSPTPVSDGGNFDALTGGSA